MRKSIFIFVLSLFSFTFIDNVYAVSDYYKDITVTFNHRGCDDYANKEVTMQLFADGKIVEDGLVTLNKNTGYSYTYDHLLIFDDHSPEEIRYEVKILEDGIYKMISPKNITYETTHIAKWVQVQPDKIQEGHTYVFTTDNWNVNNNGFSEVIYLRGDITAKGAQILPEYNIIDGMQSYYVIDGEPIENSKWIANKVPSTDDDYEAFKDYWYFTNEEGKKLTLTGYLNNNNDNVNWIWKRSGKNGFIESENAMYTNKVKLIPVANSKGRFYFETYNLLPEPNNKMQYITLSGQNQYQSGSNIGNAAQFKAYEFIDKDVQTGVTINMEESLCPKDTIVIDKNAEFRRSINVKINCDECENKKESGLVLQLFADGFKVEDGEVVLNNKNGFEYVFEDLPIFHDVTKTEIEYEVKVKNGDQYYSIPDKKITNKKEKIKKWIQEMPEDIKPNDTYALVTENLNYRENNFSRYVYLDYSVGAVGSPFKAEYNVINDKQTFYMLEEEPPEDVLWIASNIPNDDEHYDLFKDYLMFTNNEGKKLTLSGYINGAGVNWIWKRSGKEGYYITNEDAMYTNKVKIIPIEGSNGKFVIGSFNTFDEPNNMMHYIMLNNQNNFVSTTDINAASLFTIHHYVEKDITVATEMLINLSLCEALEYGKMPPKEVIKAVINPETAVNSFKTIGLFILLLLSTITIIKIKANLKVAKKITKF